MAPERGRLFRARAQRSDFVVCCAFPLQLFAANPDSCVWYELLPASAERFTLRGSIADAIHREDIRACTSVQEGLRSAFAAPGRLSHLEKCNWQFQRWLTKIWSERAGPGGGS